MTRLNELKLTSFNSLRAVVIDPVARTVVECRVPSDFDLLKSHVIGCQLAEVVALGEGVDAWVDEEGTFKPWDETGVTRLASQLDLFGVIVLVGRDEANDMDDLPGHIDATDVLGMVQFMNPKKVRVKGATLTTTDANGNVVTEKLHEDRTYDNQ